MKTLLSTSLVFSLVAAAPQGSLTSTPATTIPTDPSTNTADGSSTRCRTVHFTVNGSAQNRNISGIPLDTVEKLRAFYNKAPFITVSGPQTIAGTYCSPAVVNANNDKLQVLFHSILSNRESWQALGGVGTDYPAYNPAKYSWTQFANFKGYPTLAIDRLGNGKSSHPPSGNNTVQAPYEFALYNDLSRQLRTTNTQFRTYKTLIYVGNSYGSALGCGIAGNFPNAFDTFVLTGFSDQPDKDYNGTAMFKAVPAAGVDPRFAGLPASYLTASVEQAYINSFFGSKAQVSYEDIVADLDYKRRDTVTIGQSASVYAYPFSGAGFKGRVLLLDGEQDQAYCGPGSPVIGPASCGPIPARTKALFPNANYNWKTVDKTGHAIQLFNSAQLVFTIAHQFLAGQSFAGGPPA